MNNKELLFGMLAVAKDSQHVEEAFQMAKITDPLDKANMLIEFQGGLASASSEYETLPNEEIYDFELGIFLSRMWKKTKIYVDSSKDVQ